MLQNKRLFVGTSNIKSNTCNHPRHRRQVAYELCGDVFEDLTVEPPGRRRSGCFQFYVVQPRRRTSFKSKNSVDAPCSINRANILWDVWFATWMKPVVTESTGATSLTPWSTHETALDNKNTKFDSKNTVVDTHGDRNCNHLLLYIYRSFFLN